MILEKTAIPEVIVIQPASFADERGFFMESWNAARFAEAGLDLTFVQDNHSQSRKGVLRGIHYQLERPQGKLVRVTAGCVFDVAVDLRRSSPTFGKWVGVELSAENCRMLWIPPGFGHAFLVMQERTDFLYKCTDYYAAADERCILWRDADLAIDWPLEGVQPIVSAKDEAGASFAEAGLYA